MADTRTFRARWLFPADRPPLAGGVLVVAGGRIVAVEPASRRRPDVDLGNVAVLPGLVNAHTHLDLGALRGSLPPTTDFTQWLRAVVAYRRSSTPAEWQEAVRAGIAESLSSGTTVLGDISASGLSAALLASSPLRATVFHEIIGLSRTRARQTWNEAASWLRAQSPTPKCRFGISPHAPYSVRRGLWRLASRSNVQVAVHWAETKDEDVLLQEHAGPIRNFLEAMGAWDAAGLATGRAWIDQQLQAAPRVLYIHGNYLDRPTNGLLSTAGRQPGEENHATPSAIVFCPRTHAFFGHEPHPFLELLAAGVNVALGTDSLASNPDLSILREMRFLWKRYRGRLTGEQLLRMGTVNGAMALGWQEEIGSFAPGKAADWITVPLGDGSDDEPHDLLFAADQPVQHVYLGGRLVVADGKII